MAEQIRETFKKCKQQGRKALVTFVTAGYPTLNDTVGILKAMQDGGTDIIELGLPFTDPLADGPAIQESNDVSLANGTNIPKALELLRQARASGLTVPVILMGYYNPLLIYGEERVVNAAKEAGANGFIVVDLPLEEALSFRNCCSKAGLSYVPLVAPATSMTRLQSLASVANSFIYVVSRMGVTGSSSSGKLSASLPDLCVRTRKFAGDTPIAVGFGVNNREHFLSVGDLADGVVIGSRIVALIKEAPAGKATEAIRNYCKEVARPRTPDERNGGSHDIGLGESIDMAKVSAISAPTATIPGPAGDAGGPHPELESLKNLSVNGKSNHQEISPSGSGQSSKKLPARFGEFGGQYVPESLFDCLVELEQAFINAINDPAFWEEFRSYYPYMNRPSNLQLADRLTAHCGGARIWLKREDLNHTGSHKVNNAVGQVLIAKRLGKTRVIAETGAGQHGVATATVAAKFGMKCTVFMGGEDVRRQALNVFRMKLLGAEVISVETGSRTLRDAVNEALRHWVTELPTTHYIIGSAIGPHPFPTIVRTFQSVIGDETKEQLQQLQGKLPDAVVACVGGGSNASGMFYPFSKDISVKLLGVEAGGDGIDTPRHSATLSVGSPGVLHGVKTYLLQNHEGQISDTHSVSAGLDYSGVGPELSYWKVTNRATFVAATDAEALKGFRALTQLEGIIPALESSHAVYGAMELAKTMDTNQDVVICLSGRGDKDVQSVAEELPRLGPVIGWDLRF